MLKIILAGMFALAATQSVPAIAANELIVTDGRITEFKTMLRLSPDQERYWAPIEAALRDVARRPHAAALDDRTANRLVSLALPLFRRLDPEQKRELISIGRSLGISRLAVAFRHF